MLKAVTDFYLSKEEPIKSTLLALREIILAYNSKITETKKYGMPCFCYGTKMFCYLWTDKNTGEPYVLMVDGKKLNHPKLIRGTRKRMKILPIDSGADIPIKDIREIFKQALAVRTSS